jgi:murein DD-endopeptidase MepM/ murein hydrolase activator NlpD
MKPRASSGRSWRQLNKAPQRRRTSAAASIALATGVLAISTTAGATLAAAQTQGGGGGVGTPDPPQLTDVTCLVRCADVRVATVGSRVQLRGRNLDGVDEVRFAAAEGGKLSVAPTDVTSKTVEVKVPDGADSGPVRVDVYGTEAQTPPDKDLKLVPPGQIQSSGNFQLSSAAATPRSSFFDGKRAPAVTYVYRGEASSGVRIEVINRETKEVVSTTVDPNAQPNATNTAKWDGTTSDGKLAGNGEYEFRIGDAAGSGAHATSDSGFGYHLYQFPLQTKHSYGDGFGAGRGHEGQDVMTRCGAPIRAARGGRVQVNSYQSAAGNYVVIDGKGTGADTFYAHMVRRSPLRQGTRVHTGDVIGNVGQTGDATACHLHFEIWSAPGWYEGGHPMPSVGKLLRRWDAWS